MATAAAVILINWKRPQNIGRLVRIVAEALPAAAILVLDHGVGADSLEGRGDVPLDRCWIRTQPNAGAGARIALAATLPFDHYLCIDDDTFPTIDQVRTLMEQLHNNPDRAHGLIGQLVSRAAEGPYFIRNSVKGKRQVSVVNQIYAFTRMRARGTLRLAASVGFEKWSDVRRGDDILLSSAGPLPACIHDLGAFEECPTSAAEGIATCRSAGFRERRRALFDKLIAYGALYVATEPTRPFAEIRPKNRPGTLQDAMTVPPGVATSPIES